MIVRMNHKDIEHGVRNSCNLCPIARAIMRMGYNIVTVTYTHAIVSVSRDSARTEFKLPEIAQQFIYDNDTGRINSPIMFEMTEVS